MCLQHPNAAEFLITMLAGASGQFRYNVIVRVLLGFFLSLPSSLSGESLFLLLLLLLFLLGLKRGCRLLLLALTPLMILVELHH